MGIRKLEFQTRAAAHYHLMLYGLSGVELEAVRSWVKETWCKIAHNGDKHLGAAGTRVISDMTEIKTEIFIHGVNEYQIKLFSTGWNFTVKSFLNGVPADGYSYSVDLPTAYDLSKVTGSDAIKILVDNAKDHIKNESWKKYVSDVIKASNLNEAESVGCRNCTSRDILVKEVDNRKLYRCNTCGKLWYSTRSVIGPMDVILDGITDDVISKGFCECYGSILLNTVFRESLGSHSFDDQLRNWCNQNYLQYSYQDQMVIFKSAPRPH